MVLYPIQLSHSWSTTVSNFMLVSGIAQSGQNLALSRLAIKGIIGMHNFWTTDVVSCNKLSKRGGKDQESIQSSTTSDLVNLIGK